MSVILQFSDVRKQSTSAQGQLSEAVPAGGAEILIFPGVRIERQSLQCGIANGADGSTPPEELVGASSAGGTDE